MKKFKSILSYSIMVLTLSTSQTFASLSPSDLETFSTAGFTIKTLHETKSEVSQLSELVTKIQLFCDDNRVPEDTKQAIYLITDYPKAPQKTSLNYGPLKSKEFDTLIISRYKDNNSELNGVLSEWISTGYSSHAILPSSGGIVFWIDPLISKGQMAGSFNNHSLEVLVGTEDSQNVLPHQLNSLSLMINFCNSNENKIKYCLSHSEGRGSGIEGVITNIDEVRSSLNLEKKIN